MNDTISYQLKRTRRRRSIMLQIDSGGTVTVLAPRFALRYFIEKFVQDRADWIREKLRDFQSLREKNPLKKIVSGEIFPLWGQDIRLEIVYERGISKATFKLSDGCLMLFISSTKKSPEPEHLKKLLQQWYRKQLEDRLQETVQTWATLMGITPGTLKVSQPKQRWASCSPKGDLRFNWRLAMMPEAILDYVVVHELAHIKSHDHSKKFWSIVQTTMPDYKTRRAWLRDTPHPCF